MARDPGAAVVIGGGVVGCSIAYRLALQGVSVTLLERSGPGAGATGTSAGNVQPWYDDGDGFKAALAAESLRLHRRFLPDIKEASGHRRPAPAESQLLPDDR
ncbi:MAG: FAD-binding oxidoreductase [Chloroflexi bacterium]|nr:FAD-binding oxidoreductase [Chloroflexota bacterium]